jgi:hypothetical protein
MHNKDFLAISMTTGLSYVGIVSITPVIFVSDGFFIGWPIMISVCRNRHWRNWSWPHN